MLRYASSGNPPWEMAERGFDKSHRQLALCSAKSRMSSEAAL